MYETEETRPRALAVALDTGAYDAEASLHELAQLADTAGIEVICTAVQKKDTPASCGKSPSSARMRRSTSSSLTTSCPPCKFATSSRWRGWPQWTAPC